MFVKKMTYLREFCYLNSSCIIKSIILMVLNSSRDKFTLLQQNSVTDVFVDVGAHVDGHQQGVAIQMSINLGKTFLRISRLRKIPVI